MSTPETVFASLCEHARQTQQLASIQALLEWDQQTYLPPKAGAYRAEQTSLLAEQVHLRRTDPRVGDWLADLQESAFCQDPLGDAGATVAELSYQFEKKSKLPAELVKRMAGCCSIAQQVWAQARKDNDFPSFQPHLQEIFALKREEAQAVGDSECLYDALLDDYERGASTGDVTKLLAGLTGELGPLVTGLVDDRSPAADAVLHGHFPRNSQEQFVEHVTTRIGFDYDRGRLDVAAHPFCTELGPDDCRITTRFDESFFSTAFFGGLHEAGHGLYEQGLPGEHYGLPLGMYCSLGIHESQSRLWENLVGRSRAFWQYFYPTAKSYFPDALSKSGLNDFVRAVNCVKPSLIRVEADEATYDLHIAIRFELELALLDGKLPVGDLPGAWCEKYQQYLGVTPETDAVGVLQDIHWSAGLIGYFPTYSLGNAYASQLFAQAKKDLGSLEGGFEQGDFSALLHWLRDRVHRHGRRVSANQLMEMVTGHSVDPAPLLDHLRNKMIVGGRA